MRQWFLTMIASFSYQSLEAETRTRLIQSLQGWHFEPHRLPDEEVVACTYIIFEALYRMQGMQEAIELPLCRSFIGVFLLLFLFFSLLEQMNNTSNLGGMHPFQAELVTFCTTSVRHIVRATHTIISDTH